MSDKNTNEEPPKAVKVSETDKVRALIEAMPKHPSGVAGVARAVADAIHSCNHVVKVASGIHSTAYDGTSRDAAIQDRAKLVDALCELAVTVMGEAE